MHHKRHTNIIQIYNFQNLKNKPFETLKGFKTVQHINQHFHTAKDATNPYTKYYVEYSVLLFH